MASVKQIARDAGDDVFGPRAAVGTLAVAAVLELTVRVVGKYDSIIAAFVHDNSWAADS